MSGPYGDRARARLSTLARRRTTAALIGLSVVALFTILVFAKDNPFAAHREVQAVFSSVAALRDGAAVRVAGIDVGSVSSIELRPDSSALVTMRLASSAPSVRQDARFSIEPRLALEGNFYVKLAPGSPELPELEGGNPAPMAQTDAPVQIDQALGVLRAPVRDRLTTSFRELAKGFGGATKSSPSGAESLRRAVANFDEALPGVRQISAGFRGEHAGDLREALGSSATVVDQLAEDPRALADLVTSYAHVSATLAARDVDLGRSIEGFDRAFAVMPGVLPRVDSALDELEEFAPELRVALENAPPTLRATDDLLDQVKAAVAPSELDGLVKELRPTTRVLPGFLERLEGMAPEVTEVAECLNKPVLPALNLKVPDGNLSLGDPAWLEFLHLGASTGGSSGGFDGNGSALRLGVTEGEQTFTGNIPNLGQLEARIPANSTMNPEWLGFGHFPPSHPEKRCMDQAVPDLSVRGGARPYDWLTPSKTTPPALSDVRAAATRAVQAAGRMGLTQKTGGDGR